MEYYLYIVQCCDGTLYTGITTDMQKRLLAHNEGRGAKYTRSRRPVCVVYCERCSGKSAALKREASVKRLPREKKLALIAEQAAGEEEASCSFTHEAVDF